MDLNELKFECPASGILLGALVRAFELDDCFVAGATAAFLSSADNAGRTARRYFSGEPIPEETRKEICLWTVQAALHAGLLEGFSLPSGPERPALSADQFLSDTLFRWLLMWDSVYHRAAEGWPHPPQALCGFVVGRQAVIEVALRTAALMHLCGNNNPDGLMLFAPSEKAGGDLLRHLQSSQRKVFTRDGLAAALGVAEKSTVDRWYDGDAIPNRENLWGLAKLFSSPTRNRYQLLRWLRVQYGMIALGRRLRSAIGDELAGQLLFAIAQLIDFILIFHQHSELSRNVFLLGQRDTLQGGIWTQSSYFVLNGVLKLIDGSLLNPALWADDIRASQAINPGKRIEACFSLIGDWPQFTARFDAEQHWSQMPIRERRVALVAAALFCLSEEQLKAAAPKVSADTELEIAALRGWHFFQLERYDEAVPLLLKVARAAPQNADAQCYLGMARARNSEASQIEEGRLHLREAMRLRPDWSYPIIELARSYYDQREYGEAVAILDTLSTDFTSPCNDYAFLRALVLKELGRYSDSLTAAERAMEIDPGHAEAWSLGADLAFLLKDPERARRYHKHALHLGHTSVRRSGVAFPWAVCPKRTAANS